MNNVEKITGYFERVIFRNKENYYTVALFYTDSHNLDDIVTVGYINEIDFDSEYSLYGSFVEHKNYGIQFSFNSFEKLLKSDEESLIKYLSSSLFPSIGTKTAQVIYNTLGESLIEIIKADPNVVEALSISKKQKEALRNGILNNSHDFEYLVSYLSALGLGINSIINIEKKYGSESVNVVNENPYILMEEVVGIGFLTCEKIAKNLNYDLNSINRAQAKLIDLVLNYIASLGDSYIDIEVLEKLYLKEEFVYDFKDVLVEVLKRRILVVDDNKIFHYSQFDSEEIIAHVLNTFKENKDEYSDAKLDSMLAEIQNDLGITYDISQKKAIESFINSNFSILTGGPGTGKTTIINAMVQLYKKLDPTIRIALMAPTGRAAKRLSELANNEAYTIHSLLKWDLHTNTFGANSDNPLEYDILIIDEFSMVDQWLFSKLLEASNNVSKFLIVGDENQLPSVLPGALLSDLIESNLFPIERLSEIYRQKDGSSVVYLADKIIKNDLDNLTFEDDVRFIEALSNQVDDGILQIVDKYLNQGYSIDDIQVLAPMYRSGSGINILNNKLQELVNPRLENKKEFKYGYRLFREGDKVLQLKNIVDLDVYNGDIGIIVEIDDDDKDNIKIYVDFEGNIVEYTTENISYLTLAYCISIHKSQGSEYPIVIMPIVKASTYMLRKRLLYTAITRAKKNLILIGDKNLFMERIKKEEDHLRKTTLLKRLLNFGQY